jgi:hypothetical protein
MMGGKFRPSMTKGRLTIRNVHGTRKLSDTVQQRLGT